MNRHYSIGTIASRRCNKSDRPLGDEVVDTALRKHLLQLGQVFLDKGDNEFNIK